MYTVRQVADMSGRTERTVWRMLASGKLAHTKDEQGRVWIAERDVPERRADIALDAVARLRAEIAALRERIEVLEQRGTVRAVTRLSAVHVPSARVPRSVIGLPTSGRAWGTWVEDHGGARAAGVRDRWHEIHAWSSIGEAIEGIRQRGYQPRECDQVGCGCHELLHA